MNQETSFETIQLQQNDQGTVTVVEKPQRETKHVYTVDIPKNQRKPLPGKIIL